MFYWYLNYHKQLTQLEELTCLMIPDLARHKMHIATYQSSRGVIVNQCLEKPKDQRLI